jgi:hypothetical protein
MVNANFGSKALGPYGAVVIGACLPKFHELSSINLSGNRFGETEARYLSTALQQSSPILTKLVLDSGSAESKPVVLHSALAEADFGGDGIGIDGAMLIVAFLPRCE